MDSFFNLMNDAALAELDAAEIAGWWQLVLRFALNFAVTCVIIHFFYYPKSRRRDYYFTFMLIAASVFFIIFLLGSVKLKIGFALGIFAIFGILRYRTESVPIREMTYLFAITAISVINGLSVQISHAETATVNLIFIGVVWGLECGRWLKHVSCKFILYDKIRLITPDKYDELLHDLTLRTGLKISKIEVGHIDFLRDAVMLKVYYEAVSREINSIDSITRIPPENE
jgi:hypothetical protein